MLPIRGNRWCIPGTKQGNGYIDTKHHLEVCHDNEHGRNFYKKATERQVVEETFFMFHFIRDV